MMFLLFFPFYYVMISWKVGDVTDVINFKIDKRLLEITNVLNEILKIYQNKTL